MKEICKGDADDALKKLYAHKNSTRAKNSLRFFKTKKGEYGEGDIFIGVTVPLVRSVAKEYVSLPLVEVHKLLDSSIHEVRLLALIVLVQQYRTSKSTAEKKCISSFYIKHFSSINNWDLVDTSAHHILGMEVVSGRYSLNRLKKMALSKDLWERRIAMIATYATILHGSEKETFVIAEILLSDSEDLIHKAVGWMLREVGKRVDKKLLKQFLEMRAHKMPRTMLRYAIEHFDARERKYFLEKKIIQSLSTSFFL